MHPQLELLDQVIRLLGWPTLLGLLVWVIRAWDKGQHDFTELSANTKLAVQKVTTVEDEVLKIKDNHLIHLQAGITQLAVSNDKAVEILQEISTGITVLVDRTPRA